MYAGEKKTKYHIQPKAICAAYKKGKSPKEIAHLFNIPQASVYLVLWNNGRLIKAKRKKDIQIRNTKISTAYRQGKSIQEIASLFNMYHMSIRAILSKNGISLRAKKMKTDIEFENYLKKELYPE